MGRTRCVRPAGPEPLALPKLLNGGPGQYAGTEAAARLPRSWSPGPVTNRAVQTRTTIASGAVR